MWRHEPDWWALTGVLVLGSLTSVVAALVPAWSISRLTPVAALSGRFPVSRGESRAHRGAFLLVAAGAALLLVGGGAVFGWLKGFVTEVLSLFAWVAAIAALKFFYTPAVDVLADHVEHLHRRTSSHSGNRPCRRHDGRRALRQATRIVGHGSDHRRGSRDQGA